MKKKRNTNETKGTNQNRQRVRNEMRTARAWPLGSCGPKCGGTFFWIHAIIHKTTYTLYNTYISICWGEKRFTNEPRQAELNCSCTNIWFPPIYNLWSISFSKSTVLLFKFDLGQSLDRSYIETERIGINNAIFNKNRYVVQFSSSLIRYNFCWKKYPTFNQMHISNVCIIKLYENIRIKLNWPK